MKDFQLLIYSTPAEDVKVDVVLKDENIWATQKAMSLLFGIGVPGINKHIKHIFETGELNPEVDISKMETTTIHVTSLRNAGALHIPVRCTVPARCAWCPKIRDTKRKIGLFCTWCPKNRDSRRTRRRIEVPSEGVTWAGNGTIIEPFLRTSRRFISLEFIQILT